MAHDPASETTAKETPVASSPPAETTRPAVSEKAHRKAPRWRVVLILLVILIAVFKIIPAILESLRTVSTDDA